MTGMYSEEWFTTFAATVPASINQADIDGICGLLPLERYRRILDVGCGIGRVASPLASRGYAVTGIDVSVTALREASPSGQVDDIQFDVYRPEEIAALCGRAGLEPEVAMAGWNLATRPSADMPRYQVVCVRR